MDWNQLRTILWLRWRLTRNQWSRGSPINAVISMIAAVVVIVLGVGGAVFGFIAGVSLLHHSPPWSVLAVWDGLICVFLFLWLIGLVSDIQRSESIDLARMLHLPISLKQVFFINYLASHLTLSTVLFIPAMLGLSLGLLFSRGWLMICLMPLFVGSVFMVTAWTYCLRGWLVALMSNPRRRRTIIALMTFIAIMAGQLPNLLNFVHMWPKADHRTPQTAPQSPVFSPELRIAHQAVPFLWVGNGAMALAQGNVLPALWGAAASFGIGALGLRRAYRSTIRFYQGGAKDERVRKRAKADSRRVSASTFIERQLPGLPEEATATALATLRSLMRAPEVKMAMAMNVVFLLIFGGSVVFKHSFSTSPAAKPFVATGMIAFMCFSTLQLLFNQFGYDRAGFRALVLSPAPRRWILLGKNLALLPVFVCIGGALLILLKFAMAVPVLVILAAGLQLLAIFFLLSMTGNFVSVLIPYRVIPGSLKHTKMSAGAGFLTFLLHMLFPLMVAPLFIAPVGAWWLSRGGRLPADPVNLLISSLLLTISVLCYRFTLPPLGRFLQQREQKILYVVTHEVE